MTTVAERLGVEAQMRALQLEAEEILPNYHSFYQDFFVICSVGFFICVFRQIFKSQARLFFKTQSVTSKLSSAEQEDELEKSAGKFSESLWRTFVYIFLTSFGIFTLWPKDYLWDLRRCWDEVPRQIRTWDERAYYVIEIALYVNMFFEEFGRRERKDFLMMCVHHCATLFLLIASQLFHAHRIGCVILLTHDVSDVFLEGAKVTAKLNLHKAISSSIFIAFLCAWFPTRLYYYPLHVIHGVATHFLGPNNVYGPILSISFVVFLSLLVVLHVIWSVFILQIAYTAFTAKTLSDTRSPTLKRKNKTT